MAGNYKKYFIIVCLYVGMHAHGSEKDHIKIGNYGVIDEVLPYVVPNAIVERITMYAQKNEGSSEVVSRKALLIRRDNAKANILMSHGFMCNKFDVGFLRSLFGPEYNFLVYDFRAHGEQTEGQTCTFGQDEALDVIAAANVIKHHPSIAHLPLIAYGFSMGAAASIEAQAKHPYLFKAMILDCPFDSAENVLKRGIDGMTFSLFGYQFSLPGKHLLQKYAFHPYVQVAIKPLLRVAANMDPREINTCICHVKPQESIKKVSIPCLFICCKNDEKVTIDAIKSVYDGAQGFKRLWLTNGRRHCDSFFYNPECYSKQVNKFIKVVLEGTLEKKERAKIVEDQLALDQGGQIL